MHYSVTIHGVETVDELRNYWSVADYRALLETFDFDDGAELGDTELWDYLTLAIRDVEVTEAAERVLNFRLGEQLTPGQIEQIAHEMPRDKVSEEHPEIALHRDLFAISQLLFKAYNGKVPKTLASEIDCTIAPTKAQGAPEMDAQTVIQALGAGLNEHALITRLLGEQLRGEEPFDSAQHIVWALDSKGSDRYTVTTSDYWISEDDFAKTEFEVKIKTYEEED